MAETPPAFDRLRADLESAATPPSFDALMGRARDRRRRRVAGAALATVIAVVAIASGVGVVASRHTAAPISPVGPGHHRSSNAYGWISAPKDHLWWDMTPAQRVHWVASGGHMDDYAVDSRGDVLTVWSRAAKNTSSATEKIEHQAWALTTTSGSTHAALIHGQLEAQAVSGGFLLTTFDRAPILIGLNGSVTPLLRSSTAGAVAPGDVLFTHGASLALADPASRTWWKVAVPDGAALPFNGSLTGSTVVGASGSYWLAGQGGEQSPHVTLMREPCSASSGCAHTIARGWKQGVSLGALTASGSDVAAFTAGDGVDELIPIRWAVSHDGGRHFTVTPATALPFDSVDSMVAKGGRLYVADEVGRLWVSTDGTWTHFRQRQTSYRLAELTLGVQGLVMAKTGGARHSQPNVAAIGQFVGIYEGPARLPRDEVP